VVVIEIYYYYQYVELKYITNYKIHDAKDVLDNTNTNILEI